MTMHDPAARHLHPGLAADARDLLPTLDGVPGPWTRHPIGLGHDGGFGGAGPLPSLPPPGPDDLTDPAGLRLSWGAPAVATPAASAGPVLSTYSSGRSGDLYNITIKFQGSWTADLQQAFIKAAQTIESIIHDDVPDVLAYTSAGAVQVDDIVINATLKSIDGTGGVLGSTGPTSLRGGSYLPSTARMTFDTADAKALLARTETSATGSTETEWDATVQHEMLHAVGFGSLWARKGLVSGHSYIGKAGELEYAKLLNPAATTGIAVPLETRGGSGTADAHWSESAFKTEMMTGYLNHSYAPLSALTAHSLADLGYGLGPSAGWHVDSYLLA